MTIQASICDSSEGSELTSPRFDLIQEDNLGCVNFSLCYDPEQSLLTVRLIQVNWKSAPIQAIMSQFHSDTVRLHALQTLL